MQITSNTTGMHAGLALMADKDARDHCLVVIKGTFVADESGTLRLANEQLPLTTSDEHYGDPASSPVRHECDFVLEKPRTDVLVVGKAVAPEGKPVSTLPVRLELPGRVKDVLVVGDRRWVRSLGELLPSTPIPFVEIPLTFDRAFGGSDDSRGPDRVETETRNLVGVGFHPRRKAQAIEGQAVPNLERPGSPIRSARDKSEPIGFGVVGRSWEPRRRYAGTYDQRWRDHHAPFLPPDFDPSFNQCAPEDQQLPHLKGGELFRCVHMSARPVVSYVMPRPSWPVRFRTIAADSLREARLDTVILEPHRSRAQLVWRCSLPVGKKPSDLREVLVGEPEQTGHVGNRRGKPAFRNLDDAVQSLRRRRVGGDP